MIPTMLIALLTGCPADTATIDVERTSRVTVEAGEPGAVLEGDAGFPDLQDMDLTAEDELRTLDKDAEDVQEAWLGAFLLEARQPDTADLAFLEKVRAYGTAADVEEAFLAGADEFPDGERIVDLACDDVDLTDLMLSQGMTVRVELTGTRPAEEVEIGATLTFRIVVR